jgi:lysophospholipase L1-like esterase
VCFAKLMTKRLPLFLLSICSLLVVLLNSGSATLLGRPSPESWITAWGASQQTLGITTITDATVRMIARTTISGDAVRIRLDNTFGTSPLMISKTYLGVRVQGATLAANSNRQVFFSHSSTVEIPPGGSVESDPVDLKVLAWQDLAVSLYIPGANIRPSQHTAAAVTSYLSENGSGDGASDETRKAFTSTSTSLFWLKSIDVLTAGPTEAIVAFGDSITDGTCSTVDAHDRWEDWLALRLNLAGAHEAVVNEGIGGNTVTRENLVPDSPPGVERLDRDVLSHHGVKYVILFMGTNDIRRGAPSSQVIAGTQDIISRLKARGLKVVGVTIIPRHNVPPIPGNSGWDTAKTRIRNEVNQWIRTRAPFDAVLDFDKIVRDPADPNMIYPPFNCGDGIHPTPRGYYEMGKSVPLNLFGRVQVRGGGL